MTEKVSKKLSANDLGQTGSHQAGILIPKQEAIISFFPLLDRSTKNPRAQLVVYEHGDRTRWKFNYIYYNGKFFGGTRNEFRLTGMTAYLRAVGACVGDDITLTRDENWSFVVDLMRSSSSAANDNELLVLSGGWKILQKK